MKRKEKGWEGRLRYEIVIQSPAMADLDLLRAHDRVAILDRIEEILTVHPALESKSRIKRLREIESPQYRMRVGDYRVLYNVNEDDSRVHVIRILPKDRVLGYLKGIGYEPRQS